MQLKLQILKMKLRPIKNIITKYLKNKHEKTTG